jgi:hypothetical protein
MALAKPEVVPSHLPGLGPKQKPVEARVRLRPYQIFGGLLAINVLIAVADLITLWLDGTIGSVQLRESFDVNAERSIPTWFSSTQLFLAHATLLIIACHTDATTLSLLCN